MSEGLCLLDCKYVCSLSTLLDRNDFGYYVHWAASDKRKIPVISIASGACFYTPVIHKANEPDAP